MWFGMFEKGVILMTNEPSNMARFLYFISEFKVGGLVCPSRIARFHS